MFRFVRKLIPTRRDIRFFWQRRTRGWDDKETWSLDYSLSKHILPRLKRFKELNIGYPCCMTSEEFDEILDKMIFAFEWSANEGRWETYDKEVWDKVQEGLELFGKWYLDLWW